MEKSRIEALVREVEKATEELGIYPAPAPALTPETVAKYIDHTLLKPDATVDDIRRICDEAKQMGTASVCVNPSYIRFVAEQLRGTDVTPCCVIGFPLGATTPEVKAFEAEGAVLDGAREISTEVCESQIGGGSLPLERIKSTAVVIKPKEGSAAKLERKMLQMPVPIVGRTSEDAIHLDVRTLNDEDFVQIAEMFGNVLSDGL